ncbi:MAG TPA: hypothetical protein VLA77_03860 [Candidatus Saccharimonadales bacterium]|nr:hypothetical protein [Candidatus Saccharimonadales bacterium]
MATPQVWNGTSWVALTKNKTAYWSGSAWVEPSDIKYWNGSSWVTIFGSAAVIAFRTSGSNNALTVSSLDVPIPGTVQTGDLLVLVVSQTSNSATLFNAITGWTKVGEQRAGTSAFTIGVFTRIAQVGDAGTNVTSTSVSSANYSGQVRAYSGVNQTTPLDATTVFSQLDSTSTSVTAPAITVATTGAMLVTVHGLPTTAGTTLTAADWTEPTGFGDEVTVCTASGSANNAAIACYDRITPGTGSQGPFTATSTQARRWATATLALRPA